MTVEELVAQIQGATHSWHPILTVEDVQARLGDVSGLDPRVASVRIQKAAFLTVKDALAANPTLNRSFGDKTGISWLDKLLTAHRLKELARVKIVKAGRSGRLRYEISDLSSTWYGRRILRGLGFGYARRSVDKAEYERIREACAAIKLTLPETIEPTTTEHFFAETP